MPSELITVELNRESEDEHWGFDITGGKDVDEPISISDVHKGGLAEIFGLKLEDVLIKINGEESCEFTYAEAVAEIGKAGKEFDLTIERACSSTRKTSYERSAQAFSIVLGGSKGSEVYQEADAFFSNRVEMERTTTAEIRLKPEDAIQEEEEIEQQHQPEATVSISLPKPAPEQNGTQPRTPPPTPLEVPQQQPQFPQKQQQQQMKRPSLFQKMAEGKPVRQERDKPDRHRDWNCPWVKRDGLGLKQRVVRGDHEDVRRPPVHTSLFHFYSEPQSILEPAMTEEEVKAMQDKFFAEQERLLRLEEERRLKVIEEEDRKRKEEEERQRQEELRRQREEEAKREAAEAAEAARQKAEEEERTRRTKQQQQEEEEQEIRNDGGGRPSSAPN